MSLNGSTSEDRTYVGGGLFEKLSSSTQGTPQYRHYIVAGDQKIAVRLIATGVDHTYYFHDDDLGSTGALTDETGAVKIQESFDAWGKRRGSAWSGAPSAADLTTINNTTHIGFTAQEELDNLSLVDLNGRVYDPTVARFLSADPVVQAPYESQSLNRYSYTFDNPLNATDPTGFDSQPICSTGSHITNAGCGQIDVIHVSSPDPSQKGASSAAAQGGTATVGNPDAQQASGQVDPNTLAREKQTADQNGGGSAVTVLGAREAWGNLKDIFAALMFPNITAFGQRGVPGTWSSNALGFGKALFNFAKGSADLANPLSGLLDDVGLGTPDLPIDDDELGGAAGLDILSAGLGVFSLEGGAGRAASGYSVAFETAIAKAGAGTRPAHFAAANRTLRAAMNADAGLASMMNRLGVRIPNQLGRSPEGWSWHHVPDQPGVMQLIPRSQHQGSAWQPLLHPNQQGGFSRWGAEY